MTRHKHRSTSLSLADHEVGRSYDCNYDRDLKRVQQRLERIQAAHIVHGRSSVVLFEGWDAAGKGGIIKRMTVLLDPRFTHVWPIGVPTAEEKAHPFLWRFETRLPAAREIAVFDRSWYGRVLVERVDGFASEAEWGRAYEEINAFEAELTRRGTTLVKLFIHITQKTQDREFAERLDDPWKRWKTGPEDYHNRSKRTAYLDAIATMFERTHSAEAPWLVIDGNDRKAGRIAALSVIADRLEAAVPMEPPPLDPAVAALAKGAFGWKAKD